MVGIEGLVRVERAERFDIDGPGTIESSTSLPATVTIINLSRSGCLLSGTMTLAVGTVVSIGMPGLGARMAEVVRVAPEGAGCAFAVLLTDTELNRALTASHTEERDASRIVRELRRRVAENAEPEPTRKTWWRRFRRS